MLKNKRKTTKIIKRSTGSKPNMYFNENTTKAILSYQDSEPGAVREKLYLTEIFPAFDKLVENLIFIHGFRGLHDTYDDLKNDCVTFLYEAIHKYDRSRGTKPFSYFNVVAKHWLIIRSKQRVSKLKRSVSIDDEGLSRADREAIEGHYVVPSQDDQLEAVEFVVRVHDLLGKIRERVLTENEQRCIDAIIHIFNSVKDTDDHPGEDLLLNKRAVFFLMREISGLNPKQLTTTIASLKRHYRDLRRDEVVGIY
jgi:hypothetical protein